MTEDSRAMSRRGMLQSAGATGALLLAGCTQTGGTDENTEGLSGELNVSGSSTVFPLATAMRDAFKNEHPDVADPADVNINVSPTGTGGGFQNKFCPGDTAFNNASRPITDGERQRCEGSDVVPLELTVATDALTVIVNNDADWIDCITVDDLAQIWGSENTPSTWSEVNSDWPDEELTLWGPSEASGTFDYFRETVLGESTSHRSDYNPTEQDRQIVNRVNSNQYAMGYMGFAYYSGNSSEVKALGVDAGSGCVEPALDTASSGDYPLSRPLFTYVNENELDRDLVAEFARFWLDNATSEELVANQVGYVPLTDGTQQEMQDRLESAIESSG